MRKNRDRIQKLLLQRPREEFYPDETMYDPDPADDIHCKKIHLTQTYKN